MLVLGIGVMHVGMCPAPSDSPHAAVSPSAATGPMSAHHDAAGVAVGDHDSHAHGMGHPCVFTLSTVALIIGLVLLYRGGFRPGVPTAPGYARWRARRGRPPPWIAPTLDELSILRI